jgi:hypothetical protein
VHAFAAGQRVHVRSLVSAVPLVETPIYHHASFVPNFARSRNLFHILTIGSSKQEHELYGFHRGYFVSPRHVADTIRDFVAYFLSCDVCRDHFLVRRQHSCVLEGAVLLLIETLFPLSSNEANVRWLRSRPLQSPHIGNIDGCSRWIGSRTHGTSTMALGGSQ